MISALFLFPLFFKDFLYLQTENINFLYQSLGVLVIKGWVMSYSFEGLVVDLGKRVDMGVNLVHIELITIEEYIKNS